MFGILFVLQIYNMGFWSTNFVAFFLVVLLRALFNATVIQNTPLDKIDFTKFIKFACKGSLILVLILYVLKGVLGDWSPLVTVVLSSTILKKVKKKIWPNQRESESQTEQFVHKELLYQRFNFIFMGLLTLFAYSGICIWSIHQFIPIFGVSLFFALLLQMVLEWVFVYDQKIDAASTLLFVAGSAIGSLATIFLFSFLMQQCGLSGKAATIISVIALKIIQPWLLHLKLSMSIRQTCA